ncbi:MAG: hypothetical protein M3Q89_09565, partial [Verrucomicrobiota bacterium]|nr:hypothetical protein [Verrucomicrobiota bacterium]
PDLRRRLRLPIGLLVAALLWFGFFPQTFVRVLSPTIRGYFPDTTSHPAGSGTPAENASP